MNKILYGVGVGPGDPELLTIKAVKCLKECDVIAVPQSGGKRLTAFDIAKQAVPEIESKEILYLSMPMTKDKTVLEKAHEAAAQAVIDTLQHKSIAFLTLGDPSIYATFSYLQKKVEQKGGKCKIIPGIPSFCAAAAELGISLVEGEEMLHLIPASYSDTTALSLSGTKVLMKSGSQFPALKQELTNKKEITVMMAENCTMDNQKLYTTLSTMPEEAGYFALIIVKDTKEE